VHQNDYRMNRLRLLCLSGPDIMRTASAKQAEQWLALGFRGAEEGEREPIRGSRDARRLKPPDSFAPSFDPKVLGKLSGVQARMSARK
jgi:hypothetical protein